MKIQKMNRYTIIILACSLALGCAPKKVEEAVTIIRPVKYGTVVESEDALSETFSGTAQSSKETRMSFKVSGTVSRLNVKIGDVVRRGATRLLELTKRITPFNMNNPWPI